MMFIKRRKSGGPGNLTRAINSTKCTRNVFCKNKMLDTCILDFPVKSGGLIFNSSNFFNPIPRFINFHFNKLQPLLRYLKYHFTLVIFLISNGNNTNIFLPFRQIFVNTTLEKIKQACSTSSPRLSSSSSRHHHALFYFILQL